MSRVADRVGVRGPSLYKHVTDRAALIRAVGEAVTADLARQLSIAVSTGDARADLTATAHAYRAFVHANPNGYGLLFANQSPDLQPDAGAARGPGAPDRRGHDGDGRARTTPWRPRAPSWPGRTASSAWSSPAPSGSAAVWTRRTPAASRPSSTGSARGRPDQQADDEQRQQDPHDEHECSEVTWPRRLHEAPPPGWRDRRSGPVAASIDGPMVVRTSTVRAARAVQHHDRGRARRSGRP